MTSSRLSTEILESSHLEVVIPANSKIDFTEALRASDAESFVSEVDLKAISQIAQRSSLFYDEVLPIYIVLALDLTATEENQVHFYLSRLAISIEVVAIDGQLQRKKEDGMLPKPNEGIHVLYSKTLDDKESSWTLITQNERILAFLKLDIPLGHPRVRLMNPRVAFMVSAKLRPVEPTNPNLGVEYLSNRQSFGVNLLQPYNDDPSLASFRPRLSAHRVSRVTPTSKSYREIPAALIYKSNNPIHIYPAINVRLRHSQLITGNKHSIIASLDVEVSSYGECDVLIEKVELSMVGGQSERIGGLYAPDLPIKCHPRDDVTLLYHLEPFDRTALGLNNTTINPVVVKIQATALLSEECQALISTNWNTAIDLAVPGLPGEPNSRASRVLTSHGSLDTSAFSPSPNIAALDLYTDQASGLLQFPAQSPELSAESAGLTVTFSAPPKVYVGEVFSWDVFVVNRSSRVRKLALVVVHKRWKGGDISKLLPQLSSEPTEHVLEDTILHSLHRSLYLEPAELVCLMNDVRIGPLPPSACHATELKFIALSAGVLNIDSIRVIDFSVPNTSETTECRDLPSIIAVTR